MNEHELVQQVLLGNERAVRQLYSNLEIRLKKFFGTQAQTEADVEELVQDTFLHFLDALPLFQFQSNLSTFALGIAKHELMDYWRKKYAKRLIRTVPILKEVPALPYGSTVVSQKIHAAMERAYAELKPLQAQVLRWKYEEGKSVKEMAELLGWTTKAVEAYLYRSRKAFQAVYIEPELY